MKRLHVAAAAFVLIVLGAACRNQAEEDAKRRKFEARRKEMKAESDKLDKAIKNGDFDFDKGMKADKDKQIDKKLGCYQNCIVCDLKCGGDSSCSERCFKTSQTCCHAIGEVPEMSGCGCRD